MGEIMKKIKLRVEGMTCSACSNGLEKYLNKQDGIVDAVVNLVLQEVSIQYEDNITISRLEELIKEAGFKSLGEAQEIDILKVNGQNKKVLILFGFLTAVIFYFAMGSMVGLPSIIDKTCTFTKQDESLVTFAYNISKEDEKIDFFKSGLEIKNLIRGLSSIPGAYCYLDNKRLKIYEVEILKETSNKEPGTIIKIDKESIICTCKDSLIKIKDIQLEGKKRCLVKEYLNGININDLIGKVLK